MSQFINTKKEQFLGFDFFKRHYLPPKSEFDYRLHRKEISEFFAAYGFEVSMVYADFYSHFRFTDFSDRFLSDDVYYFYILPAVNRYDFIDAYMDKNGYDHLFPDIKKPRSIVKNINGHFYNCNGDEITIEKASDIIVSENRSLIIKPSIESGGGTGVGLIQSGSSKSDIIAELDRRRRDYIIQERVVQNDLFAKLNPSSLNTIRINTYRSQKDGIIFVSSFVRMGGGDSITDNASSGGCFCHIHEDGMLDEYVIRYKTFNKTTLEDYKGVKPFKIPNYDNIISIIKKLHSCLPYFDVVGWDMALDKDDCPVFIEMNLTPQSGGAQMTNGPMFGPYLEEVMERASQIKKEEDIYMRMTAPNGSYKLLRL